MRASFPFATRIRISKSSTGLPVALLVTLSLVGCGMEEGITSLSSDQLESASYGIEDVSESGGGSDSPAFEPIPVEAEVVQVSAQAGAVLTFRRHTLNIPPGALRNDQEITLEDLTDSRGYPCARIGPSYVKFQLPVTLQTHVADLQAPESTSMYWVHTTIKGKEIWSSVRGLALPEGGVMGTLTKAGCYAATTKSLQKN